MRNSESPYLTDLFVISLRWLVLFGLAISLGTGENIRPYNGSPNILNIIVLVLPALWNGYVSALAIFSRRLTRHREINTGLDLLFAFLLFITTGGLSSDVFWVALLPMFSSAIYFEKRGLAISALLITLSQVSYTFLTTPSPFQGTAIAVMLGFNLVSSLFILVVSSPIIQRLRSTYQKTVKQRQEGEQTVKRQEHDRMKALFAMVESISSTLNYNTVLETMLDTAISQMSGSDQTAPSMVGAVFLFGDTQDLQLHVSRGFVGPDSNARLPAVEGALREMLQAGGGVLVQDPKDDPELGKLLSLQEQKVVLCLPLIRSMNAYGVILFAHADAAFFTQDRVEILQMMSNQAVIALQNSRLYQDLSHEKERIVQSQEEAQKKLARDLHDGPTQSVAAIAMRLSIARRILGQADREKAVNQTMDELNKLEDLARRTTQEIRHMLFTLRPLVLENEGLIPALKTMADKMHDLYQQKVVIDADEDVVAMLDNTRQGVIFSLAEEAVGNARKHAKASEIWVRLKFLNGQGCIAALDIIDNGVGFDVQAVMSSYDRRGSLGMINLRERSEQINGLVQIDSVPGKGTRVRVTVPLTADAIDQLHNRR